MMLLPLGVSSGPKFDLITIDSPDGRYRRLDERDLLIKRGRYLYRHYSTGPDDFCWDLEYHNPAFRDYDYPTTYEGPEATV